MRARPRVARPVGLGLALGALGVVFGDIGTSPLYTFKTVLALTGGRQDPDVIAGSLSLVIWTLILITTVTYGGIAMSMVSWRSVAKSRFKRGASA